MCVCVCVSESVCVCVCVCENMKLLLFALPGETLSFFTKHLKKKIIQ